MGLDITAYRGLVVAPEATTMEEGEQYDGGYVTFYDAGEFDRAADLDFSVSYKPQEEFAFRAGSYGGYNHWRNQLAELAGYGDAATVWNEDRDGPFSELINFSDCEGVIGATVSAKLSQDFAAFQAQADAHDDEWFRELYARWRKAFELAAQGGCVEFH